MARKLLLVLCVAAFAFGGLVGSNLIGSVYAQEVPEDQRLITQYREATEKCAEPSLECLVYYTVNYVAIELTGSIAPLDNVGLLTDADNGDPVANPIEGGVNIAQKKGVVPAIAFFIGQMYANPAANTHVYVADLLDSVNIAKPAYAQGLGYGSLNPILNLWKTFRNIAYTFYVFLFIVIGFLIMFRKKVGSAAITAQQAIPSIIISLLFVTFSYAIAGVLIDGMYVIMYLIVGMFQVTFTNNADIINFDIFSLSWTFMKNGAYDGNALGRNLIEDFINNILSKDTLVGDAFGWIGGITVGLVIAVAVLIGSFKLFFELLKSYATIVLSVVVAPVQLMMGALPGNDPFVPWLKNMIANLAAFPVVLMVAVMYYVFTDGTVAQSGGFMPPFLVGRGQAGAIANLMGLAILLAMPEIVKEIKKKLGATEGFGGMVVNAATKQGKEAIPLGGRLGLGGSLAVARGGIEATGGGLRGAGSGLLKTGKDLALTRDPRALIRGVGYVGGGIARGTAAGAYRGARKGLQHGSDVTNWVTRSVGANQPDILNPITRAYDRVAIADPEERKRRAEETAETNRYERMMDLWRGGRSR